MRAAGLNARAPRVDTPSVGLSLHHADDHVMYLDEDAYAVIAAWGTTGVTTSAWPAVGTYGPIPHGGAVGRLVDLLDFVGPELWQGKRRGDQVCLERRLPTYDLRTVLLWGADCVEHLARVVNGVDGNVVDTLALARAYARTREFDHDRVRELSSEAEKILEHLRKGGVFAFARGFLSRLGQLEIPWIGSALLNPSETEYEASEYAIADQRAMQVALMHATKELCGADPLVGGREAAKWCRRARARNAVAQEASNRSQRAGEASWLNLFANPFASGTLARSLPTHVSAIQDGSAPEAEWQAERLHMYLARTADEPLARPEPF
jgi:hypothetical protein